MLAARPRLAVPLLPAALLLACTSSSDRGVAQRGTSPSATGPAAHAAAAPTAPAAPAAPASALLTAAAPLVLDGVAQPVYLDRDRVLHVGDRRVAVDHSDPGYHWDAQAALSVVALDGARQAVLLATPTGDDEDPPNRYQLFVVDGDRLTRALDQIVGVYGMHELRVPGDGTVRYTEDGWTACQRLGHPARAPMQEVALRLDPATGQMKEAARTATGQAMVCAELSACPFVYVEGPAGEAFAGEILRDLRGRAAHALQPLELAPVDGDVLRLRIAEEKPETTFLDELYLEVDGVVVRPAACAGDVAPAYCRADGVPLVLRQGDELAVELRLPAGAARRALRLMARGYYVPTPTAHLR